MNNVIFLAQGAIKGMKAYGPRSAINIAHTNILVHNIGIIKSYFKKWNIHVVTKANLEDFSVKPYKTIQLHHVTSIKESLQNIINNSNKLLLINDDVAFNYQAVENINLKKSSLIFDNRPAIRNELCGLTQENKVLNLAFGLDNKLANVLRFSELYYLVDRELNYFHKSLSDPAHKKYTIFELINKTISMGGELDAIFSKKIRAWTIQHPSDIIKVERILK